MKHFTWMAAAAALACAAACADTSMIAAAPPPVVAPAPAPVVPSTSLLPPPDAPPIHETPPGPYAVTIEANPTLATHTIYRPTDLAPFTGANALPIVAWGNGACSNAGLLFKTFLTQFASNGYVMIASGAKDNPLPAFATGAKPAPGAPPIPPAMTHDQQLIDAIDWAVKENLRKASRYYHHLDATKIAVMGQSCGGLQAIAVSNDPRIKTTVVWNSGVFIPRLAPAGVASISGATKDSLTRFHSPVAYFIGGPADLAYANAEDDFKLITVPVFKANLHVGHGGTYNQPGGGWFGEVGVKWLDWRLKGDTKAATYFEGPDCALCLNPIWSVEKKKMK